MPSVSQGLFRWLCRRSATLEDFADRLNHVWTVGLLLLLACIVSWRHTFNDPISCWTPAEFTSHHSEYANKVCWENHVLFYPSDTELNMMGDHDDLDTHYQVLDTPIVSQTHQTTSKDKVEYVTLYQRFPLILCFQALLFKLPNIVMYVFHGYTGISFDKVAGLTAGYENLNLQERQILGRQIARYVLRWCRLCGNCLPWRLLTLLWFLVKVLFFTNAVVQLATFDKYITTFNRSPGNTTWWYGDIIVGNLLTNNVTLWKMSPAFPRQVTCILSVSTFGGVKDFMLNCQISANEFTEKVLMYLWVWLVFVTIVTCVSFVVWTGITLIPVLRKRYIVRAFEAAEGFEVHAHSPANFNKFCETVGEDGVMVLKLIGANSSELVVRDVVCNMWTLCYPGEAGAGYTPVPGHLQTMPFPPNYQTTHWQGQQMHMTPGQVQPMHAVPVQGQPMQTTAWQGQQTFAPVGTEKHLVHGNLDWKED